MLTAKNNNNARLSSPINVIPGIGPKTAKAFLKLDVATIEDLFFFMPRRYEDRRFAKPIADLEIGYNDATVATVEEIEIISGRTEAIITDGKDRAKVVWFTERIGEFVREGMKLAIYGPVKIFGRLIEFAHPEFEILYKGKTPTLIGKIFPIYPGTADLTQRSIKKFVDFALKNYSANCLKEFLPQRILNTYGMMSFSDAIFQLHEPTDENTFIKARNRLSFDELFLLQAGIIMRKRAFMENSSSCSLKAGKIFNVFKKIIPFKLTDSQRIAITEILADMERPFPMNRLLQGDVGSGKTLVAVAAMIAASDSGTQAALMAPTEILAQQHYIKLKKNLEPLGLKIALLTGSLKGQARKKILKEIADGETNIIIGTHALFSEDVNFNNLSLVIVDEQHRFGVLQRGGLISKGKMPHVLAMTATPIPRTLIMSVYGDLEVSTLHELPAGRKKIQTVSMTLQESSKKLPKIIRDCAKKGHQIYWVCPLIEESERALHSVNETYRNLCEKFEELRISMLHGQLPIEDKSDIMQSFSSGEIDLLVCTTVIEVGVDVPNAALMIIQDAGQFGLAQLHQLRGRVGRGSVKSACILLENAKITPEGLQRLSAMVDNSDGFELAEVDLIQRGPGELCGTHQHGVTDFRVADIVRDEKILTLAREEAKNLLTEDPDLISEPLLKHEINRRLGAVLELAATS